MIFPGSRETFRTHLLSLCVTLQFLCNSSASVCALHQVTVGVISPGPLRDDREVRVDIKPDQFDTKWDTSEDF